MRWLGIDPGGARVGIAACDEEERVAVPLEVVPEAAAFPAIRGIARREEASGIVIGLAVSLDGTEGRQAAVARRLGERLARELGIPVEYEDERFTSAAAERARGRGSRDPRDDIAAALILQQFIDRRRRIAVAPHEEATP
ncbi:MAG: Holliday junction resolvase RuvX [Dehalococcoidia bacterium]|nr:Holliday junction resolvase RuvX [Dehalococcoidia bacterium]